MISTSRARQILGNSYKSLTDLQVEQLVKDLYVLADIVTDQVKANVSNKQLGVIDSALPEVNNGFK